MSELSKDEILRYQRHLTLPHFGEAAQLQLKSAKVLVVGAGGLGCPVLQYLAAAGVGTLGIVDDDVVSLSNLQRQILFNESELGRGKAELAAQKLRAMNPHINCVPHATRLGVDNALDLIAQYDFVVDGSDNFPTRYLISDACVLANKPLVYGALYTFQGQASVFNWQGGPTYRCLFPEPPRPEDAPNCSEIGVVGVLPGMIGMIQATEVIKLITGVGEPLTGKLLMFDALTMRQQIVSFQRVPEQAAVTELRLIEYSCGVAQQQSVVEVEPQDLQADRSEYQLLDVREDWERAICALPGAHLPLGLILEGQADFEAIGFDTSKPTYVYCKGGVRSLKAAEAMQAHYGFKQLKSLRGGILGWAAAVDPAMQTY
ncbi:molybdopterin-synthase adenylyltransferase MoeB [Coraliomargarita sp. SDUM461003]|uniref:Molybdopterin-synthase adenylyltransferase MoeB n=1 Tax=Thalassobacterium maritimum TaxID=3041265 RepID=A0ABU1AS43_9BACT|nr:molybdopterin-synthase adenylyltransferase MoeB [Coraliomargarita sp. SDUM461003]MDQ8206978.1 molybdopterin-synthase adenylyltransferase MoeB [Coraliomargarita sp. SDUM461003]